MNYFLPLVLVIFLPAAESSGFFLESTRHTTAEDTNGSLGWQPLSVGPATAKFCHVQSAVGGM